MNAELITAIAALVTAIAFAIKVIRMDRRVNGTPGKVEDIRQELVDVLLLMARKEENPRDYNYLMRTVDRIRDLPRKHGTGPSLAITDRE